MRQSMTGYASGQGEEFGLMWSWDVKSVNNRGLDIRIRVPDWIEGLEQALRAALAKRLARGSVTVSLRLQASSSDAPQELNEAQLDRVLTAMLRIEEEAMARGLSLTASSAADPGNHAKTRHQRYTPDQRAATVSRTGRYSRGKACCKPGCWATLPST